MWTWINKQYIIIIIIAYVEENGCQVCGSGRAQCQLGYFYSKGNNDEMHEYKQAKERTVSNTFLLRPVI